MGSSRSIAIILYYIEIFFNSSPQLVIIEENYYSTTGTIAIITRETGKFWTIGFTTGGRRDIVGGYYTVSSSGSTLSFGERGSYSRTWEFYVSGIDESTYKNVEAIGDSYPASNNCNNNNVNYYYIGILT